MRVKTNAEKHFNLEHKYHLGHGTSKKKKEGGKFAKKLV